MARVTRQTLVLLAGLAAGATALFLLAANIFPDNVMAVYEGSRGLISAAYEESRALVSAATHTEEIDVRVPQPPLPTLAYSALPTLPYRDDDAYSVLSTWIRGYAKGRRMTIQAETGINRHSPSPDFVTFGVPLSCFPPQIRSEYAPAFNDFTAQNRLSWFLERSFDPNLKISLVPGRSVEAESKPNSKAALGGYFTFSAVGLSPDRTKAMLYVSQHDGRWGWGNYFLFKKQGTAWILVQTPACGWIV